MFVQGDRENVKYLLFSFIFGFRVLLGLLFATLPLRVEILSLLKVNISSLLLVLLVWHVKPTGNQGLGICWCVQV